VRAFRTALIGSAFVVASLGAHLALADGEMCTDDEATCPTDLAADDASIVNVDADQAERPTPVPQTADVGAIAPPTVVEPTPAPQASDVGTIGPPTVVEPTPAPQASDVGTIGPPTVVQPFAPAPAPAPPNAIAPQPAPLVIAPGDGADKQHLPPGPPTRAIDP
jgi:hypothetical protein